MARLVDFIPTLRSHSYNLKNASGRVCPRISQDLVEEIEPENNANSECFGILFSVLMIYNENTFNEKISWKFSRLEI